MTQTTAEQASHMNKLAVLDFYADITQGLANKVGLKAAVVAYGGKPESATKMDLPEADLMNLARYLLAQVAEDADMDAAIDAYIAKQANTASTALVAPVETPLAGGDGGSGGALMGEALEGDGSHQEAMQLLTSLPFGVLLGGPLTAAVDAQTRSSMATLNFVMTALYGKDFVQGGLGEHSKMGLDGGTADEILYVKFMYETDNGTATIQVPLLTILPIPYLQVDQLDVDFVAKISSVSHDNKSQKNESKWNGNTSASTWWGRFNIDTGVTTDGVSMSDSGSSVNANYEMNVRMRASQGDMPGGMARVLGMLEDGVRAKTVPKLEFVTPAETYKKDDVTGTGIAIRNVPVGKTLALINSNLNKDKLVADDVKFATQSGGKFKFDGIGVLAPAAGKVYKLVLVDASVTAIPAEGISFERTALSINIAAA